MAFREEVTGARARFAVNTRIRNRRKQTIRLDRLGPETDLARELAAALRTNEGGVTHVWGWEGAFSGPEGAERLYRFNLLRETIFTPRTVQIWWMSESFRDTFMRHAPDTWSYMRLRLIVAEAGEYVELPSTLARLVRSALKLSSYAPIPRLSFVGLQSLDASFSRLTSEHLTHLSGLSGLQRLNLNGTNVRDVSPLSSLATLQTLSLKDTQVSDVSPLKGLFALKSLDLSNTPVSNLTALSCLSSLQRLDLRDTRVRDVTALGGLSALRQLHLGRTDVFDVASLAGLSSLEGLSLEFTFVYDVSSLATLTSLEQLYLSGCPVSDISFLSKLAGLKKLHLYRTQVWNVSPLARLRKLTQVILPSGSRWNPRRQQPPKGFRA